MSVATATPDPDGDGARAVALMADVSVWTADDWRRLLEAAATGATVEGLLRPTAKRFWAGEAKASYDQSVNTAGMERDYRFTPEFWVARAQAAAAIEAAEQARIGNLIAWKQLQTAREARSINALPAATDEIDQQIEEGLGI